MPHEHGVPPTKLPASPSPVTLGTPAMHVTVPRVTGDGEAGSERSFSWGESGFRGSRQPHAPHPVIIERVLRPVRRGAERIHLVRVAFEGSAEDRAVEVRGVGACVEE